MRLTTTILSGVMLPLALTLVVSSCARRTDKPVTMTPTTQTDVRGSRTDMSGIPPVTREKTAIASAEEAPIGGPATTSRMHNDVAQCSLVMRNPAMRTEMIFGPIQVRVFDDVTSPLNRKTARPYDRTARNRLTAAEIDALERQKGRPLTDSEIRSLEMERAHTATAPDVVPLPERTGRTLTEAEIRDLELQRGRSLTEAEISDLERQRGRPLTEANAPTMREGRGRTLADAQAGETGGKQQESGSAQQAGTSQEIGGSRPTSSEHALRLSEQDRLTTEQRSRLYGDEARIADRRGNLIWSGWLKPNETVPISNASGPIRYDYRFVVDDRFHDERGASCNNNVITVP